MWCADPEFGDFLLRLFQRWSLLFGCGVCFLRHEHYSIHALSHRVDNTSLYPWMFGLMAGGQGHTFLINRFDLNVLHTSYDDDARTFEP